MANYRATICHMFNFIFLIYILQILTAGNNFYAISIQVKNTNCFQGSLANGLCGNDVLMILPAVTSIRLLLYTSMLISRNNPPFRYRKICHLLMPVISLPFILANGIVFEPEPLHPSPWLRFRTQPAISKAA